MYSRIIREVDSAHPRIELFLDARSKRSRASESLFSLEGFNNKKLELGKLSLKYSLLCAGEYLITVNILIFCFLNESFERRKRNLCWIGLNLLQKIAIWQ